MKTKATKTPIKSVKNSGRENREKLVRIAGLEPARVAPLPPQSSVSANSTICALDEVNEPVERGLRKSKVDSAAWVSPRH